MTLKATATALALTAAIFPSLATEAPDTTARQHRLRPLEVLGVKQIPDGGTTVEAVTRISGAEARRSGIDATKGVSLVAPNFYIPAYGSRMTSSIYVRGLGARIDQPVVGLTVDNIPYLNKDAYDFDISDIESIEVLRGAQGVLNGRNTMGGQINIRTLSPLRASGLRAMVEYGSKNSVRAAASYYGRLRPVLGMSLAAQYRHTDGFYRNSYDGSRLGRENSGSLRWKTAWRPNEAFSLTNTATATFDKEWGYPYTNLETGLTAYNDTCSYRRSMLADALTVAWAGKRVVVTSITSVQYLDDCMNLDQDFTPADYFTLRQSRRELAFTEDLFTRGSRGIYSWLGGVFGFYKSTNMQAPVTFKDIGIAELIEGHRNGINPDYPIAWDTRRFVLDSDFDIRTGGFAVYHESTVNSGIWRFEAGLRLDVEHNSLDYHSRTSTGFSTYRREPDGSLTPYSHTPIDIDDRGKVSHTYVELLPKLTVSLDVPFKPYVSFSKGYKAGGYNTQMFSNILQQDLMAALIGEASKYMPPTVDISAIPGFAPSGSVDMIASYKPEYSWNYEVGAHISCWGGRIHTDLDVFYIDIRNQQLTVFPDGDSTGRMMTNAGRSRSFGAELAVTATPTDRWNARASYGYTNARFLTYRDGAENYRGKTVPYAPAHTLFGSVQYRQPLPMWWFNAISFEVNCRGVGPIYWDEANLHRQDFYALAGASVRLQMQKVSLDLWGENILNTRYSTFYFKSVGNSFVQRGPSRTLGMTLRYVM